MSEEKIFDMVFKKRKKNLGDILEIAASVVAILGMVLASLQLYI